VFKGEIGFLPFDGRDIKILTNIFKSPQTPYQEYWRLVLTDDIGQLLYRW
jgi:hypothetical protein